MIIADLTGNATGGAVGTLGRRPPQLGERQKKFENSGTFYSLFASSTKELWEGMDFCSCKAGKNLLYSPLDMRKISIRTDDE